MTNGKSVIKRGLAVFLVLLMVLSTFVPMFGAAANSNGPAKSVSRNSSRGVEDMTLYLKNDTSSHYVFDYSTTYIFDTNVGNRSAYLGDTHTVTLSWDMFPVLAGDLHVQGDVIVRIYLNTTGVSVNGNLRFTLKDISYKQDVLTETIVWEQTSPGLQVQLQSGIILYSVPLATIDHTFLAGHGISLTFEISGGQSAFYGVWYGNATYDSRIELPTLDHLEITQAYTLNYLNEPTTGFAVNLTNKTVKVRANVTDPFGGYDIYDVRVIIKDPTGAVVVNNLSMAKLLGTPVGFESTYEYLWNFSSHPDGKYHVVIWAIDNNGHDYYYHREQYNYDGYWKTMEFDFWVGGVPANFFVKVLDSKDLPLEGALVSADRGMKGVTNVTNSTGVAGLSVFPSLYTINVFWEDVLVHTEQIQVTNNGSIVLHVGVYYPTIKVVDANNAPLQGASVFEVHPNGTIFLSLWVTDEFGQFNITRAPEGQYRFVVKWRDIEVADADIDIEADQVYTITASVFTMTVTVEDSHGQPLPGAQVVITEFVSRIVFDSKITNLQGQMSTQLPIGRYEIVVYWAEAAVGEELNYLVDTNKDLTIQCDVFYFTVQTVDSRDKPVSDAQVLILSNITGSLLASGRTNEAGKATLRLPTGDHKYQVYWRDIKVAEGSGMKVIGDVAPETPYKIVVEVYYATIRVVDSRNVSLPAALITVTSQTGGVFEFKQTNASGMSEVRVPKGTHVIYVQWKGVDVAQLSNFTVTTDIPASAPFVVNAAVYYMTVKIVDSKDVAVSNAVLDVMYQNSELADAGVTDINGLIVIRLPHEAYDLKVAWKDIPVGELKNQTLDMDKSLTIKVAIFYVTYKAVDSRQVPVADTHVTVLYQSGAVMDSGTTDDLGLVQMRLPGTTVDVVSVWKMTRVGELNDDQITVDATKVIGLRVYYLTVTVKDVNGGKVPKAMVTVYSKGNIAYDAGKTNKKGMVEFRLAEGSYNVSVRFTTTYMLSAVDEAQTKQVTMSADTPLLFKLKSYPPPIYTTVAFGLAMFIVVLVVLMLVVALFLNKKLKDAAVARAFRDERAAIEKEEEGLDTVDLKKPEEPKKEGPAEAPKDAPKEPAKTDKPAEAPKEAPKEPPKTEKPAEVPKATDKSKDDEEIDKALKELDK